MTDPERSLLLVEDDRDVAIGLQVLLEHSGWQVHLADTASDGKRMYDQFRPDAAIIDVMLPDGSGLEVLEHIKSQSEGTPVIVASGVGTIDMAVDAMRRGAESFLAKPYDIDNLELLLEQALRQVALHRRIAALERATARGDFVGDSRQAMELRRLIGRVADAPSPVLLLGESGTGKGLVASLIHSQSQRRGSPFVDLNCAGLSRELVESELFGHERGAFTDARAAKPGLLEIATGGTVFLDEVGELDASIQARLLKALEEKKFRRVGGVRDIRVDIRLIAATNRDLQREVDEGRFRSDLFYRLAVVRIDIPPLRDRGDDIPLIARSLLGSLSSELGHGPLTISDRAMERLRSYSWPGNVRELRNVLERAALLSPSDTIRVEDLPPLRSESASGDETSEVLRPLDDVIFETIQRAIRLADGNVRQAARMLRVSPTTIYSRLRQRDSDSRS